MLSSRLLSGSEPLRLSRRAFLQRGTLVLAGAALGACRRVPDQDPAVRIGLITDIHYADKDPGGSRHYRDSMEKMDEAVAHFNEAGVDFAVELGDFVDAADTVEAEIDFLKTIDASYGRLQADRHYVLGNHCVATLTKDEFMAHSGAREPYYAFDHNGFHFVILDACFLPDGTPYGRGTAPWDNANVPHEELAWLRDDLARTTNPTLVFTHQRLDESEPYCINNRQAIRQVLEASGQVLAVFQGHSHQNAYTDINGIHYCVVRAMVEDAGLRNNSYADLYLYPGGTLRLNGFARQSSYSAWP